MSKSSIPALALLLALAIPASASASANHPTGAYAPFAECPLGAPKVSLCMFSKVTGGEFVVGKRIVPIGRTLVLQAGLNTETESGEIEVVAAENGNTLTSVALPVPGGLLGIVAPLLLPAPLRASFDNLLQTGESAVTATLELAKPANDIRLSPLNLLDEEGTALQLPVRVRLANPFLGGGCYIGSPAQPIVLNLTTGTTSPPAPNKPIKGGWTGASFSNGGTIIAIAGAVLVDNAWSSPTASGCGGRFSSIVDPILDTSLGLPSPAGHNTAILSVSTLELAVAEAVRLSE